MHITNWGCWIDNLCVKITIYIVKYLQIHLSNDAQMLIRQYYGCQIANHYVKITQQTLLKQQIYKVQIASATI